MNHAFPSAWKEGLYQAIARRRDMRSFLPKPVANDVLARILAASHHAGSVGFMQPWNFIVVKDLATRKRVREHVEAERLRAARKFRGARRKKYLSFKLEGVLEAPLNICVTCDPTRGGPEVIGRNTMPETDLFSTCCAIQNLWLAARVEGLGVGWVSILEPQQVRVLLGIPQHVLPVAYLCLGHVTEFSERPMLETADWAPRLRLDEVVYEEGWGQHAQTDLAQALTENNRLIFRAEAPPTKLLQKTVSAAKTER